MTIHNFNEFATAFNTTPSHIESVICNLARMDLHVDNTPTGVKISHFTGECNANISCSFNYPFTSKAVTAFIESFEPLVEDMLSIYDDPFDLLMEYSNPGEDWTIEDAGQFLSEAEASGWVFPDYVTPQYILDIYNDMEPEEEGDE